MAGEEYTGNRGVLDERIEKIRERIVPFGFSLGMIALGTFLFLDDLNDFGKFSTPDHPSRVHHWWIGLLIMLLGLILLLITVFW